MPDWNEGEPLPVPPAKTYASADLLDPVKRAALDAADEIAAYDPSAGLAMIEAGFVKGAGANASLLGGAPASPTPAQRQAANDLAAGAKLLHIARDFIQSRKVRGGDSLNPDLYAEAVDLVEAVGQVVGFYEGPEEQG